MLRLLSIISLTLLSAACLPSLELGSSDRAIERWIGHPMRQVLNSWGPPSRSEVCGETERHVYMASHFDARSTPANLDPTRFAVKTPYDNNCRGIFRVNSVGVVTDAFWLGEECWR
ncbi:MAG: hypothetical protein C0616_15090 [Desulfuromonas sp.]|nr:MAG: hypothetical protein C0616_15090 [Desulfuromonas sp.]